MSCRACRVDRVVWIVSDSGQSPQHETLSFTLSLTHVALRVAFYPLPSAERGPVQLSAVRVRVPRAAISELRADRASSHPLPQIAISTFTACLSLRVFCPPHRTGHDDNGVLDLALHIAFILPLSSRGRRKWLTRPWPNYSIYTRQDIHKACSKVIKRKLLARAPVSPYTSPSISTLI